MLPPTSYLGKVLSMTRSSASRIKGAKTWDVLEAVSCGSAVLLMFAFAILWYQYAATCPKKLDAASGNIYPLDTHGAIVYLTRAERWKLNAVGTSAAFCFLSGAAIGVLIKKTWGWNPRR